MEAYTFCSSTLSKAEHLCSKISERIVWLANCVLLFCIVNTKIIVCLFSQPTVIKRDVRFILTTFFRDKPEEKCLIKSLIVSLTKVMLQNGFNIVLRMGA